jgi:ABC-type uncharacterized transport system permease subunit
MKGKRLELAELLFWPALFAYGEATVALLGETRRPGRAGRFAIWGVRLGWLAQTALLVLQAARAEGFPWSSWAGALNLLSWLVVGVYLIWGCRPRFRLAGLGVMPVAAVLLALAYAGGGIAGDGDHPGALLALHVALMLAALAGFMVAGGLAALFLWQERRLKQRVATILRLRVPPLEALEQLSHRTVAVSLATLTLGIAIGLASYAAEGARFDAAMGATLAVWLVYAAVFLFGLRGRRGAYARLGGFVLVVAVLPLTHFAS